MSLIINVTIDVEPDSGYTWEYAAPLSFKGVYEGIGIHLSKLFEKYSVKPTYLINNVVLQYADLSVFDSIQKYCELGSHLHHEFLEPQAIYNSPQGQTSLACQCYLTPTLEFEKLKTLTDMFFSKFGFKPNSFRAGRFAANSSTLQSLIRLGYKIDSSVTSGIRWLDETIPKAIDFRFAPRQPYFPSVKNINNKGNMSILEIPVSVAGYWPFSRTWLRPLWCNSLVDTAQSIIRV